MSDQEVKPAHLKIALIVVAILLPTLVTWIYFSLLADAPKSLQAAAYGIGKTIQFALPVIVLWRFGKWIKDGSPRYDQSIIFGIGIGIGICAAMYLAYRFILIPSGVMDAPTVAIKEKLESSGLQTLSVFIVVAIGYALIHSLLEEYYWRWFVFGNLQTMLPKSTAIAISSLGFALHHVLVLARYFGWASPWTYVGTVCIAIGGAIWAWLYKRESTLLGPWISHGMVDAMIFFIGYELAF